MIRKKNDLTYYHDINFEWLASYLNNQLDVDFYKMELQPVGIFARHVNHDIKKIEKMTVDGVETLKFELNRDGVYDNLPHGVFHKALTVQSYNESNEQLKESIKIENEKEAHARKYFQIFESELLRINVLNRSFVLDAEKRDFGFAFDQLVQLLPFSSTIYERDELIRIMQLFPFLNNVYENYVITLQHAISYILNIDANVTFFSRMEEKALDTIYNTLGETELGWTLCCGDTISVIETIARVSFHTESDVLDEKVLKVKTIAEWVLPMYYTIEIVPETDHDNYFTLGVDAELIKEEEHEV